MSNQITITDAEIANLKEAGYSVHCINDQEELYAWHHPDSGASQSHHKERQPYRKDPRQAWYDCLRYVQLDVPATPEPDWKNR